jgi:hypothetical protein
MSASQAVKRTLWLRLWETWHGPVEDERGQAAREAALARLTDLEQAARRLGLLEAVEAQRERER